MRKSLVDEIISRQPKAASSVNLKSGAGSESSGEIKLNHCIDFGSRLMSLAELSRHSGIGMKTLRRMIAAGVLRPIKVPYSLANKYSPRQLAMVLAGFNS